MKVFASVALLAWVSPTIANEITLSDSNPTSEITEENVSEKTKEPSSIWLLGVRYSKEGSVYLDTDDDQGFTPMFAYLGKHFYLKGFELGYQVNPMGSSNNIAFSIEALTHEVDFDDSNNTNLALLEDRDAALMASLIYQTGPIEAVLSQDISGEHDGLSLGLGIGHSYELQSFELELGANFVYQDKTLSNHLYGVSQAESDLTSGNIRAYDASGTRIVQLNASLKYALTESSTLSFEIENSRYFGLDESPIVEQERIVSTSISYLYLF